MPGVLPFLGGFLILFSFPSDATPPGKTITVSPESQSLKDVLGQIEKQTGLRVALQNIHPEMMVAFPTEKISFWNTLQTLATTTKSQIRLREEGREIILAASTGPTAASAVDGPFRVVVQGVTSRREFQNDTHFTEIELILHWEPWWIVHRVDAVPRVTTLRDDQNSKLSAISPSGKTPVRGAIHTSVVRITGVPRSATKLSELRCEFVVTASERFLPFTFTDLTSATATPKSDSGISATLLPVRKLDDLWEVRLELTYPESHPEFESFESWATQNRIRLWSPDRTKSVSPVDYSTQESGRQLRASYRFSLADLPTLTGWTLEYETPSPLLEFPVRCTLRDILLP